MKWTFAHTARQIAQDFNKRVPQELEDLIDKVIEQIETYSKMGKFELTWTFDKKYFKQFKYQMNRMGFKIKLSLPRALRFSSLENNIDGELVKVNISWKKSIWEHIKDCLMFPIRLIKNVCQTISKMFDSFFYFLG